MKYIILLIALTYLGCSVDRKWDTKSNKDRIPSLPIDIKLVIADLLTNETQGYVLIANPTLEYSSYQQAKEDQSAAKSIVKFDTARYDHHTPENIGDDRFYNWGSPLVCRKVIKDHGDVVEVKTMDPDEDPEILGHGTRGADYIYELTTFVRKIDLVPVLGTTYEVIYEDQTGIILEPGVAIGIPWNSDQTQRVISIQELHFPFSIPDHLMSLSYIPKLKSAKEITDKKMLHEEAVLFLNGEKFCAVAEIRNQRLRTPVSIQQIEGKYLIEVVENGISLTLKTTMPLTESYSPSIQRPILTNRFSEPPRWYYRIQKGTPVYWEDGRHAGKVRQYFGHYSENGPGESTHCDLMPELFQNLLICFKLDDIEVRENE